MGIFEGITTWNAIRIIQNENGMKLKTDDPTFTTTKIVTLPSAALADHWIFWLFAHTCRHYTQTTSSFGDLKGTNIHFSKSILPVSPFGNRASGQYTLSGDQKRITASV